MELPSFQAKEIVELVESKVPFGKFLITLTLFLGMGVVIVWSAQFIWHSALAPITRFITALATGTSFTLHITLGSVLVIATSILVYGGGLYLFGKYVNKIVHLVKECHKIAGECVESETRVIKGYEIALERFQTRFAECENRITALEKKNT